jgi:hypothetical protein
MRACIFVFVMIFLIENKIKATFFILLYFPTANFYANNCELVKIIMPLHQRVSTCGTVTPRVHEQFPVGTQNLKLSVTIFNLYKGDY